LGEEVKQLVKELKVMKIWAEMRRARDDESRKRKGSGDAAGPEVKKARIWD
jgi:hypothetical protein